MEKSKLQDEIEQAFNLISAIPVSGDGVEIAFYAKEHLRAAYKIAGEKQVEKDG